MRIATYNAASIRARLPRLTEWITQNRPEVLVIQETKVEDDKFPLAEFAALGYHVAKHGQKSWNGVAILSTEPIEEVEMGFGSDEMPNDARLISGVTHGVVVINSYVPNGNTVNSEKFFYKLKWLEEFRRYLDERYSPDDALVWLGDVNIAPTPLDVYDSKKVFGGIGHHPEEFVRLKNIVDFGLVDVYRRLNPEERQYTFWDFTVPRAVDRGLGWRIDHIYTTPALADITSAVEIDIDARKLEKPSDHTFVTATIDL